MLRSSNPGSGFDAPVRPTDGVGAPPVRVEHAPRALVRLDEPEAATSRDQAAAAAEEVDPLDAFMASLAAPAPKTVVAPVVAPPAPVEEEVDPLDAFMASLAVPIAKKPTASKAAPAEVDPLDAFMASLNAPAPSAPAASASRGGDLSLDESDPMTSYLASAAESLARRAAAQGVSVASLERVEAERAARLRRAEADEDEDEGVRNAAAGMDADERAPKKRAASPLRPVDHEAMAYKPFRKAFYKECPELTALPEEEMRALTEDFDVTSSGPVSIRLCYHWSQFGFEGALLNAIKKQGFEAPTAIQAAACPVLLSGHDLLATAQTGSGKTYAFCWPMLVHILAQPVVESGDPIALVLAPTRELAQQIYDSAQRFLRVYGRRCVPVLGGMQKHEQVRALRSGCDAIVATPGRLLELLRDRAFSCARVTFLVLDEADRMLSLGFGDQVRELLGQCRPDRQVALFSATMDSRVESLARACLKNPMRISVGASAGAANSSIRQVVDVLPTVEAKFAWLVTKLPPFVKAGPVLVFAGTKLACEDLTKRLTQTAILNADLRGLTVDSLHGDHHQAHRSSVLARFKRGGLSILVATDVAARGLDIAGLPTVVCFDAPRSIDAHTHRVGRTGRAGRDGVAYTLLTPVDERAAPMVYEALEAAQQELPIELWNLANKCKTWTRGRTAAAVRGGRPPAAGGETRADFAAASNGPPVVVASTSSNISVAAPTVPTPVATPVAVPSGVHPSRMWQVPGAAAAAPSLPPPPPPPSNYQGGTSSVAAYGHGTAPSHAQPRSAGGRPSYNAVAPPSYNNVPPPYGASSSIAAAPVSLAATIAAAHARAAAMRGGGAMPTPVPTPAPSFAPSQPAPNYAAPAPAYSMPPPPPPPPAHAYPPQPSVQSYPSPPPPPQASVAPAGAAFVHPSRMGLVPQAAAQPPPPPPPPSFHSPPPVTEPEPPRKKSRWG